MENKQFASTFNDNIFNKNKCFSKSTYQEVARVEPVVVGGVSQLVVLLPRGEGDRRDPDQTHDNQLGRVKRGE